MINLVATLWALWDEEEGRWYFGIVGNQKFDDDYPKMLGLVCNREHYLALRDKWIIPGHPTLPLPFLEDVEECFGYYHYHA